MADTGRYSSLPDILSDLYAGATTPVNAFNATVTGPASDVIGNLIQKGTQRPRDPQRDTTATADDFAISMGALERLKRFIPGLGNGPTASANAGAAGVSTPDSPQSEPPMGAESEGPGWKQFMSRVAPRERRERFALGPAANDTITMLPNRTPALSAQIPGEFGAPARAPARTANGGRVARGNGSHAAPGGALDGLTAQIPGEFGGALADPVAPAAPAVRKSLAEQYQDQLKNVPEATTADLTAAQKAKLQMDFFLRMMSGGSKAGARSVGVIGDAGLATSAEHETMMDKARTVAERRRGEGRENAFRMIGFADKDADNVRSDRQIELNDQERKERNALLRQQIAQGKWSVMDNGKTGSYILYDKETGTTRDTGIKVYRAPEGDKRPAEVQLLEYLQKNPKAIDTMARVTEAKDKGTAEKDPTKGIVDQAIKLVAADVSGKTTFDQAVRTVTRQYGSNRGADVPQTLSRKSPEYAEALKHPKVGGDKTKLEAALKANGIAVAD